VKKSRSNNAETREFVDVSDNSREKIATRENGRVIALHQAVELDPSVLQLADLPVGWCAVRHSVKGPWKRKAMDDA